MYFNAVTIQRAAHRLYRWHVPLVPRLLDGLILLVFNSTVPHTAEIGKHTACVHRGMSVGIHQNAKIGERVFIGLRVTVGGRAQDVGPPVVEDDVFIGTNAILLCEHVGRGAVIGSGAVVLEDVPAGGVVAGNPAKLLKTIDAPYWAHQPKKFRDGDGSWTEDAAQEVARSGVLEEPSGPVRAQP
jgi:serine O-acetyltransferase